MFAPPLSDSLTLSLSNAYMALPHVSRQQDVLVSKLRWDGGESLHLG